MSPFEGGAPTGALAAVHAFSPTVHAHPPQESPLFGASPQAALLRQVVLYKLLIVSPNSFDVPLFPESTNSAASAHELTRLSFKCLPIRLDLLFFYMPSPLCSGRLCCCNRRGAGHTCSMTHAVSAIAASFSTVCDSFSLQRRPPLPCPSLLSQKPQAICKRSKRSSLAPLQRSPGPQL